MQNEPGEDQHRQHRQVVAQHRPRSEEHDQPGHQRQVGVPGLAERGEAVRAGEDDEHQAHGEHERGAAAPEGQPQGGGDGDEVRARGHTNKAQPRPPKTA